MVLYYISLPTGMQNAVRRIQKAWKRYKARVTWGYVRSLPAKTAVALVRTYSNRKFTNFYGGAPSEGIFAARRREFRREEAARALLPVEDEEGRRREIEALCSPVSSRRRVRRSKGKGGSPFPPSRHVPLSGPEYHISEGTLEALRLSVLQQHTRRDD